MGNADYYASGEWNFICDFCGRKAKSHDSMLTWDGYRVCKFHKEARNPQDFLRGVKDDQSLPWSRPIPTNNFIGVCTLQGNNAIPGYATPGCATPAYVNLAFYAQLTSPPPVICTIQGSSAIPGFAVPGCSIPASTRLA